MTPDGPVRPLPRRKTPDEQAADFRRLEARCDAIDQLRRQLDKELPNSSRFARDIELFKDVIGQHLGRAWVMANAQFHADEKPGNGAKYLRRDAPLDITTAAQHYLRLHELASRLFEFSDEDFYERMCANLSRRDLEGAAFEADVVRMLVSMPRLLIDLRGERNVKGDDYDIDVWFRVPDLKWSIEVKTKQDEGPYSKNGLLNTIRGARRQLPVGGTGSIFLKLPHAWATDARYQAEAAEVFESFFGSTSRVQAVVTVWDVFTHDPENEKSWDWEPARCVFRSSKIDRMLDELLDHYERLWGQRVDLAAPTAPF